TAEKTDPLLRHPRPSGDRHADHRRDRAGRAEGLKPQGGPAPLGGNPPRPATRGTRGAGPPLWGTPLAPLRLGGCIHAEIWLGGAEPTLPRSDRPIST